MMYSVNGMMNSGIGFGWMSIIMILLLVLMALGIAALWKYLKK